MLSARLPATLSRILGFCKYSFLKIRVKYIYGKLISIFYLHQKYDYYLLFSFSAARRNDKNASFRYWLTELSGSANSKF